MAAMQMDPLQADPVDRALRLIALKTDFAARMAVVRAQRRMGAELLRTTAPKPALPGGVGRVLDRYA